MAFEYHLGLLFSLPDYVLVVVSRRHEVILVDAVDVQYISVVTIVCLNDAPLGTVPLLHGPIRAY